MTTSEEHMWLMRARSRLPLLASFALAAMAILVLGVVYYRPLLQRFNPMQRWVDHEATTAHGLIEAIYKYQKDVGAWPRQLEDVTPRYIAAMPQLDHSISYDLPRNGEAPMLRIGGPYHIRMNYKFASSAGDAEEGWDVRCEGDRMTLGRSVPQHFEGR